MFLMKIFFALLLMHIVWAKMKASVRKELLYELKSIGAVTHAPPDVAY